MDVLLHALRWFTGGDSQYMVLYQCMRRDYLWIGLTVVLDAAVAAGYALIAMHWWKNSKNLPDIPAKRALANMRNIFAFCGICGYAFIPIKMVWPAWRLYDIVMAFLVYFTWRYAWGARDLKVVYSELGKSDQLAKDLEQAREETKEKNFFLNAISHDLRTPLNGLVLQTSVAELCLESNDPQQLRSALNEIRASTFATSRLLDRLLDYARLGMDQWPHDISDFSFSSMLSDLHGRFRALAEQKQLRLDICETNGLMVRTDRIKLERVLANLVDNAIKFTNEGQVRVEAQFSGSGVEIHVIDSGIGISSADAARLFEEFYQVHNTERDRSKGFGIGLAISRRLARQLGGDILFESSPGHGSRFSLVLPDIVVGNDGQAPSIARYDTQSVGVAG
jgi:signal transduction histidine kinase